MVCLIVVHEDLFFGVPLERAAGVDGNVALITIGAGERADTTTAKDPIVGFVFDAKGLIADISLKGAKFTKLNK